MFNASSIAIFLITAIIIIVVINFLYIRYYVNESFEENIKDNTQKVLKQIKKFYKSNRSRCFDCDKETLYNHPSKCIDCEKENIGKVPITKNGVAGRFLQR
jgi:hypothetical protein